MSPITTISSVEAWACRFELPRPLELGNLRITRRDFVVVRIATTGDVTGQAYALSRGAPTDLVVTDLLGPLLVGQEALDIPRRLEECSRAMVALGTVGIVQRAISLVDICLWDIKGQVAGFPLWRLFGGYQERAPVMLVAPYAQENESDSQYAGRLACEVKQGYRMLKLYPGGSAVLTSKRLAATRQAVGRDVQLVVDLAWSWTNVTEAILSARAWDTYGLSWIEDPFPADERGKISALSKAVDTAIACGDEVSSQATLESLINDRAVDLLRLDATTIGGFSGFLAVHRLAVLAGYKVSPHAYPEIHQHCVFGLSGVGPIEVFPRGSPTWCSSRFIRRELPIPEPSGTLNAPTEAGLGLLIDWGAVKAHALRETRCSERSA